MTHRIFDRLNRTRLRAAAATVSATVFATGMVLVGLSQGYPSSHVQLQDGTVWVASNAVGQLTLLDGASAEVAAGVSVAQPGSSLQATQQGATGYALNRSDGSVVRIDGATLEPSPPVIPVPGAGDQLSVVPTLHGLYAVDAKQGLVVRDNLTTLARESTPYPLAAQDSVTGWVVDHSGRLWALDQRTGDLVWLVDGTRHTRPRASTPGDSYLTLAGDHPALVDTARHTAELLDSQTGMVVQSMPVDLRPGDAIAVAGSPNASRLLISVDSRRQFLVCTFGATSCAMPIALGSGRPDFGAAVEVDDHAVVPDYATGQAWIIDLADTQVIGRRLFDHPLRFDVVAHDGVVFYNDPNSAQAGVLGLDGRIRAITKYDRGTGSQGTTTVLGTGKPLAQSPPMGPPNLIPSGSPDDAPGVAGPGGTQGQSGSTGTSEVSIDISPHDHGEIGDDFEFTVVPTGAARITSAQWTLGADPGTTGITLHHRWNQPGTYTVGVTATLASGRQAYAGAQVVVDSPDAPPSITRLGVAPDPPQVGQPVHFSADLTGRRPQTWSWTITGDRGAETTATIPDFDHTFATPGAYTITLTVTAGTISTHQSRRVTVNPIPPDVHCGETLTSSATLREDLICAGEVAVMITASNVVLDLGGHTITAGTSSETSRGIIVAGHGTMVNTTIRDGTVSRFNADIDMTDTAGVIIDNERYSGELITQ